MHWWWIAPLHEEGARCQWYLQPSTVFSSLSTLKKGAIVNCLSASRNPKQAALQKRLRRGAQARAVMSMTISRLHPCDVLGLCHIVGSPCTCWAMWSVRCKAGNVEL